MKKFLVFGFLISVSISNITSQILTKNISQIKIYGLHSVEYNLEIDLDKKDTLSSDVKISFLNKDIYNKVEENYVSLSSRDDIKSFTNDLKKSLEFLGKKQSIKFSGNGYGLEIKDNFSKSLYIINPLLKSKNIYKKEVIKLIAWLENLDLKYLCCD